METVTNPPASSSTRAARSTKATDPTPAAPPLLVRRKAAVDTLRVVPLTDNKTVVTASGVRHARVGDLQLVDPTGLLVDVVPPELFLDTYQPVDEGALTLSSAQVARIAKVVRFGACRSADELVLGVEDIAKVMIGDVRMDWTPGQMADIKLRAEKRGWTVEKYLAYVLGRFLQEIWNY